MKIITVIIFCLIILGCNKKVENDTVTNVILKDSVVETKEINLRKPELEWIADLTPNSNFNKIDWYDKNKIHWVTTIVYDKHHKNGISVTSSINTINYTKDSLELIKLGYKFND